MNRDTSVLALSDLAARSLYPGAHHYMAFVGPPDQFDLMGASQFALLIALGLRDSHRVLDFGCGSLRVGRLLIPYLQRGNYYGVDPNSWLIEDAIARQIGRDQIAIKCPHFYSFDDFAPDRCGREFDFIVAQSIFSHAGADIVETALRGFSRALARSGLALTTFIHPGQDGVDEFGGAGWVYPDCVAHSQEAISQMIERAALFGRALPWFHPRQTWYVLSRDPDHVPGPELDPYLRGTVLNVPDWEDSR